MNGIQGDLGGCIQMDSGELERLVENGFLTNPDQLPSVGSDIERLITAATMEDNSAPRQTCRQVENTSMPCVEIVEQPRAKGMRFRYECEGRSAGSIPGEHSTQEKKTYPTIKICNHQGPAVVVVSCVTKDLPKPRPHPHALVGKDCMQGVCSLRVRDTNIVTFPHLGIQCAKKKDVQNQIKQRKKINVDPFQTGFDDVRNIDLNVVRLCFQVFLPGPDGKFTRILTPVCSQPILDRKAQNELIICRIDHTSGRARGGDEVFLLCEKVNKDDISVRFYETDDNTSNGNIVWQDLGDFGQGDVHRQLAIVFRTPAYRDTAIRSTKHVYLQLRRPSDGETSESIAFTYMPEDQDPHHIEEKRKRKCQQLTDFMNDGAALNTQTTISQQVKERLKRTAARRKGIKEENPELPSCAQMDTGSYFNIREQVASQTMNGQEIPNDVGNYQPMQNVASGSIPIVNQSHLPAISEGHMDINSSFQLSNQNSQNPLITDVNFGQTDFDVNLMSLFLTSDRNSETFGSLGSFPSDLLLNEPSVNTLETDVQN